MELLSVIRRWALLDQLSIREIAGRTGLSRNTIRKYLRGDVVEPASRVPERPSKLDAFAEKLSAWLRLESGRPRKQRRTIKRLHADWPPSGLKVHTAVLRRSPALGRSIGSGSSRRPAAAPSFRLFSGWAKLSSSTGARTGRLSAANGSGCKLRTSSFATAAPSLSGPIRCRRTRCCSTRIIMRFGCSAACRAAASTTI